MFVECNDHEGETWSFFFPLKDDEVVKLKNLSTKVSAVHAVDSGFNFYDMRY